MTKSQLKKKVLKFLDKTEMAALSTVSPTGLPQVATIYFVVDDQFNLYFATTPGSRKYGNLKRNKSVALAITNHKNEQTIQMEGEAVELGKMRKNSKEFKFLTKLFDKYIWSTVPVHKIEDGLTSFFKVKPSWVRWADFKAKGELFHQIIP